MPDFGSFVAQTTPWHKVMSLGPLIESSKDLGSLLHRFCDIASSQSSGYWLGGLYLLLVLLSKVMAPLLMMLALTDIWVNYRARLAKKMS